MAEHVIIFSFLTKTYKHNNLPSQARLKGGGNMKTSWKLQDAKSQFSKLVEHALKKGPQYVTRRGIEAVVILSIKDYEALISTKPSFKEVLLNCPKVDQSFEFKRQKDLPRSIEF